MQLNTSKLLALRDEHGSDVDVEVVEETGSTNADLLARVGLLTGPLLRVAKHQTAGRGRAGRTWHSDSQGSLTFSLAWRFNGAAHQLSGLPLAVGTILAEVLCESDVPVQLKWPNDVLKEKKKLAGILVETTSNDSESCWAIIGIGLNLQISDALEAQIASPSADAPWLARMDRNELLARILNRLAKGLPLFQKQGFFAFVQRWNALHAYENQLVRISDAGNILSEGRAIGVDAQGRLLLQTADAVVPIVAGDVSLRPVPTSSME